MKFLQYQKDIYFNLEVLIIHLRRTKSPTCVVISHMSGPKNTLKCCLHRLHVPRFFKQSERDEGQRKAKLTNILVAQAILVYNMIHQLCIDMVRQFSVRLQKWGDDLIKLIILNHLSSNYRKKEKQLVYDLPFPLLTVWLIYFIMLQSIIILCSYSSSCVALRPN